jgi:hypothetical protein
MNVPVRCGLTAIQTLRPSGVVVDTGNDGGAPGAGACSLTLQAIDLVQVFRR